MTLLRGARGCALVLCLCGIASVGAAQVQTQILDLNGEALDAYQNLDLDTASAKLQQALSLAENSGYSGPEVAQTLLNLGVIAVAGYGNPEEGLGAFISALCLQPAIQLDPLLSTPDVQQVFLQAQADAGAGACGSAGPATGPAPQQSQPFMPATAQPGPTRDMDWECPPGVKCGPDGESASGDDGTFARAFANVQLALGFAFVQSGMRVDRPPPLVLSAAGIQHLEVFLPPEQRQVDLNNDGVLDAMDLERLVDTNMDGVINQEDEATPRYRTHHRFALGDPNDPTVPTSAWVPDADSFDDDSQVQPVSPKCEADGIRTGPTDVIDPSTNMPFTQLEPSSYCARVERPGFVNNLALRFNVGYFLTETLALSVPVRIQFDSGEGSFSNLLLGLRGELVLNEVESATGFPVSIFLGGTYGQIQAMPPPKDPSRPAPYVVSGMTGAHAGVNVRFRIHRHFGFIVSPEVDVMFPDFLFNADVSIGLEGAL